MGNQIRGLFRRDRMALDPETRQQLIETVRRFVNEVCRPNEQLVSESNEIPQKIVQEMRELGLFGISISEEYGGLGLTMEEECRTMFEFCRCSPAFRSANRPGPSPNGTARTSSAR